MYVWSVFKNLIKKSNFGSIIYFILNAILIFGILGAGNRESLGKIAIIYAISICVTLSPIGEWFLSLISGARKMSRVDMRNRILPLVQRVQQKAKAKTPDLTNHVIIKVMYDPNPNAFAVGRKTICVTEGLFGLSDEMIEGILAHEFAHLALHHTDIQLLIGGGNFVITTFILILKIVAAVMNVVATALTFNKETRSGGCLLSGFSVICAGLIWIWTKFCMLFLMWSSRANEFEADKYAFEIGLGYELAETLDAIGTGVPQNSFFKALYSTHPETNDRIGKLQELGVPYSRY